MWHAEIGENFLHAQFLHAISVYFRMGDFHPLELVGLFQVASDKAIHTACPLGSRGLKPPILFDDVPVDLRDVKVVLQYILKDIVVCPKTQRLAVGLLGIVGIAPRPNPRHLSSVALARHNAHDGLSPGFFVVAVKRTLLHIGTALVADLKGSVQEMFPLHIAALLRAVSTENVILQFVQKVV